MTAVVKALRTHLSRRRWVVLEGHRGVSGPSPIDDMEFIIGTRWTRRAADRLAASAPVMLQIAGCPTDATDYVRRSRDWEGWPI